MPHPSSLTRMSWRPPSSTATSMVVAPASSAFSTSSFTTDAGRSTTSPAAIWFASTSGSTRMRPPVVVALSGSDDVAILPLAREALDLGAFGFEPGTPGEAQREACRRVADLGLVGGIAARECGRALDELHQLAERVRSEHRTMEPEGRPSEAPVREL